jgi:hypothetical protein
MFNKKLIVYLNEQKNKNYIDDARNFFNVLSEYKYNNDDIILYKVYTEESGKTIVRAFAKDSTKVVQKLFNKLEKEWKQSKKNLKIFAKRKTRNVILFNIYHFSVNIVIVNLVNDYSVIRSFLLQNKDIGSSDIITLYRAMHILLSPENYGDVLNFWLPILTNIVDGEKEVKEISISKDNINALRAYKNIIPDMRRTILIGPFILKNIFGITLDKNKPKEDIKEFIYTGNFKMMIQTLKDKGYDVSTIIQSDFEFRNHFVNIKANDKKYRMYNGLNYCYQYIKLSQYNVGNILLQIKFLMLNMIFSKNKTKDDIRGMYSEILEILGRVNYNKALFNTSCIGKNKSPYIQYYSRQFELRKPPWSYAKIIKDSINNKE